MIALYDDGSYSFSLPAIPNVLIPLDTSGCKKVPPTPTGQIVTNVPTTKKSGKANCNCHAEDTSFKFPGRTCVLYQWMALYYYSLVKVIALETPIHNHSNTIHSPRHSVHHMLKFHHPFMIPITGIPQTTLLAIEVAAPAGGLLLLIICVMCCVIIGLCVRQSRLKHIRDNYNFQRLSIAAQDYDEAEDDDEEEEEGEVRQK